VAGDAAQAILVIYGEPIEQRVIHAVKLYCAVANLYGVEYSVLHHRTPVARAESVAVAPELHAAETVKNRLETFHAQTEPLKDYYSQKGILATVQGQEEVADTTALVFQALRPYEA
jgi:adenylate kinase family enzyme